MGEVIGYGEDSLTYWALTQGLDEVLKKLSIKTKDALEKKDITTILYRPSLGRGRGCYGEFDAILVAKEKKKVYLIESKWWRSKEITTRYGERVELRDAQYKRHNILERSIKKKSPDTSPSKSLLKENLEKMLEYTGKGDIAVENVILLFWRRKDGDGKDKSWTVNLKSNKDKKLVNFHVIEIDWMGEDFFTLGHY